MCLCVCVRGGLMECPRTEHNGVERKPDKRSCSNLCECQRCKPRLVACFPSSQLNSLLDFLDVSRYFNRPSPHSLAPSTLTHFHCSLFISHSQLHPLLMSLPLSLSLDSFSRADRHPLPMRCEWSTLCLRMPALMSTLPVD